MTYLVIMKLYVVSYLFKTRTCHLAGRFVRHLQDIHPEYYITNKDILCTELAAIALNLGCGPFSNTFTKLMSELTKTQWKVGHIFCGYLKVH